MSAFAESLETEWEYQGLGKAEFVRAQTGDIESEIGQLTSHPLINSNELTPYGEGSIFEILQLLYIDDGAFIFNSHAASGSHNLLILDKYLLQILISTY